MIKTFIKINKFKIKNLKKDGLKALNKGKFKASPWINNIIKRKNFNLKKIDLPVELAKIKVKHLGFKGPTKLKKIYKKAKHLGLMLVPPEIAIYTRLIFKDQKNGEWIRFATPFNSMLDSDNIPHLPKLGKGLGYYFLETYWSYPDAIFHPKNEFIFLKNENFKKNSN